MIPLVRLDTVCQLCRQHEADHVWRRERVIHLCGRCFHWLARVYNDRAMGLEWARFTPVEFVFILAGYRGIKAGRGETGRFIIQTAVNEHVTPSVIQQMVSGRTYGAIYESMAAAGIPGPEWRPPTQPQKVQL